MKRILIIFLIVLAFAGCAPGIYQVYNQYDNDPNFEHTKISGELIQLASFLVPKEQKNTRNLLKSVNSVDIVHYTGKENLDFQKSILRSLKRGGYREILKNNKKEEGTTFFVKKGLSRVKEFHVLNYLGGNVSVFSIDGRFSIFDIEKVYRLIKKQESVKELINNFDFRKIRIEDDK